MGQIKAHLKLGQVAARLGTNSRQADFWLHSKAIQLSLNLVLIKFGGDDMILGSENSILVIEIRIFLKCVYIHLSIRINEKFRSSKVNIPYRTQF